MKNEDIPEVSNLLCNCYRWLGNTENLTLEFIDFLTKQRGSIETVIRESETETYLVAVCNDSDIAGMVSVNNNEITKLYVDPKRHRQGVGQFLFKKAEEIITQNGYTKIIWAPSEDLRYPFMSLWA